MFVNYEKASPYSYGEEQTIKNGKQEKAYTYSYGKEQSLKNGKQEKASPYLKGEVAAVWLTVGVFDLIYFLINYPKTNTRPQNFY